MPQRQPNRLIHEQSPYLLQHAYNPVDWRPWGLEAFTAAAEQDKPVFLSIGYSTCHWCHVMERESFEDEETARLLSEIFICVKVDREERPDVDMAYMTVCQLMTGSGGWPLTLVLTPDKRPLFVGTYLPKESRMGRVGLKELTIRVYEAWRAKRSELLASASTIMEHIKAYERGELSGQAAQTAPPAESAILDKGEVQLAERYDQDYGGFGDAPKFPAPHNLLFLLRQQLRAGESKLTDMVTHTLEAMRRGGIWDHVGFGFHRYSTDREWLLPHFEKMLYDQAMLSLACVEAWQVTGNPLLAQTSREIFTYVLRDLISPEGGFYSAEDADSEGEEGKFYVFTLEEIRSLLSPEDASYAADVFGLREEGNFTDEATGQRTGANIIHLTRPLPPDEDERVERIRQTLMEYRGKRVRPHKDDKVLADWNGLMIAAMAKGGAALGQPEYIRAAEKAAAFVLSQLRRDGELLHRWREGQAGLPAHLDDYAFMVWGLTELYQATFEPAWLHEALQLCDSMLKLFWSGDAKEFRFATEKTQSELPISLKELHDAAIPAGNSIAVLHLLRLGRMTGRYDLEEKAGQALESAMGAVAAYPAGHSMLLCALDYFLGPGKEVVIAGEEEAAADMAQLLCRLFLPRTAILRKDEAIAKLAPFVAGMEAEPGKAAAFVCSGGACQKPVYEAGELEKLLIGG